MLHLANLTSSGTTLSSFNYSYNSVGNRMQVLEANGDTVTWSYDPDSQLTNEQRSGASGYSITYTYDAVGNRTLMVNNAAPTTYSYNAGNEIITSQTGSGVTTYTFDGNGNLLTSLAPGNQLTTNTWDAENRLTQAALPSAIVDIFTYNGDGQRVQKQDSTGVTKHVWDGSYNILAETSASDVVQVVYTVLPAINGYLISQSRGGVDSFYLLDSLGSTRNLANGSGFITDSYLYDSFGNILQSSGTTITPFRYLASRGYYFDADLIQYLAQGWHYNPQQGRWLTRLENAGPVGVIYAYPVNPFSAIALLQMKPAGVTFKGCEPKEEDCIAEVLNLAINALKNQDCFGELLKGHKNCPSAQLSDCLIQALNMMAITCYDLAENDDPPCSMYYDPKRNYSNPVFGQSQDNHCRPMKDSPRCDPCKPLLGFAFGDNCSLCDGTTSVPIALCRTPMPSQGRNTPPWPGKPPVHTSIDKVYCKNPASKNLLAALLVHEAAHSCVGSHILKPGGDDVLEWDPCGRPDAGVVEGRFNACLAKVPPPARAPGILPTPKAPGKMMPM